ncbi:MAG TPA: homogentisate 1,2-dioxygenase, partial [Nevskiaceae bacterium]|nr:homogentisate 1,2-dioxygenase [Nevskiaceae bacterium]
MRKYISVPQVEGQASRQAHADLPAGAVERELGKEGFFGPASHMIHPKPPTGWTSWEGPLRPRAFDCVKLGESGPSPWNAQELLFNANVRYRWWRCAQTMDHLARNADGDELLFIHTGHASLYCDYGHLELTGGDYLVLPRGTMWRIECSAPVELLLIEATNSTYSLPDKGLVGEHAIFDPAMLDRPRMDESFRAQQQGEIAAREWRVSIKRNNLLSTVT